MAVVSICFLFVLTGWGYKGRDTNDLEIVLQMADTLQQEQIAYQLKASHRCSRLVQQPTQKQGMLLSYEMWNTVHSYSDTGLMSNNIRYVVKGLGSVFTASFIFIMAGTPLH
jgi:hypothetical protein